MSALAIGVCVYALVFYLHLMLQPICFLCLMVHVARNQKVRPTITVINNAKTKATKVCLGAHARGI